MSRSRGEPPADGLPAVLAVDGGNSKTDVALVAANGTLLASARGPGVPGTLLLAETVGVLGDTARAALAQAGLSPAGPPRIARHLSACVANDTFALLRAGLDGPAPHWGVGVTCGAGINCVGVAPDGRITRFLALGDFTGDWGGGSGLGREVLWWAIRAEDGRGPQTALREAVPALLGEASMYDVAVGLHTGKIGWDVPARLVPLLFQVAGAGDAVAVDLVRRLAGEVCVMALTAIRRLGLDDEPVPVVLGGGVLAARDPLLIGEITKQLADEAPRAEPRVIEIPPVAGAAMLGLDHIGAPLSAQARLRDAYLRGTARP